MSKLTLKSAKRDTNISRTIVRNAVSSAYIKRSNNHSSKTDSGRSQSGDKVGAKSK